MKFKNILDPEGQVYFFNKIDKIFKNKLLNNSGCRNDCRNIRTVVFTGDSTFLYLLVKWTVKRDSRIGKDAFIATNFVLVPITLGLRIPCLRVPGLRS